MAGCSGSAPLKFKENEDEAPAVLVGFTRESTTKRTSGKVEGSGERRDVNGFF
jgi:hypothetical protein